MNNTNMVVRLLNNDENYLKYYFEALNFDDSHSWILDQYSKDNIIFDIDEARLSAFTFGLFNEDELIGMANIIFECDELGKINFNISLIIKPNLRNKGLGSYFLNFLLELIKEKYKMIDSLNAIILSDNLVSEKLFTKFGFVFNDFSKIDNQNVGNYIYKFNRNKEIKKEMSQI